MDARAQSLARALLAQHDLEAARGPVSPTQLGLADLVRAALPRELWQAEDRPSGECFCGRPLGHGPLGDADERLP